MKRVIFLVLLYALPAVAERPTKTIRFPEEELARESVMPVFENKVAVKKKLVPKEKRFELGLQFGNQLTEAFYDAYALGLSGHYHFNEFHALELSYQFLSSSESQFVDIIEEDVDTVNGFNFDRAPTVESMILGAWEFTPYYGKISLTKQRVMNLSIYGSLILGMVDNGASNVLAYGFGLGQKLYFSPNWGLRFEIKGLFYDVANPLLQNGTFPEENKFNMMLNIGLLRMFPSISG
tara:strand:- start:7752 stop:8459 length:708 start_codon:yes stop_codon:yes gene_type:complete